ncbi:MAG: ImuA family protein, partial [Methyloceanibacter sp.]|uniref:ImuA family protein n=1 Tax=Methyloceanibacter sp. TaxID=1965321 RepID=UPI003D6D3BBC
PPGGGPIAALRKADPLPDPPPFRGREFPLHHLHQGGLHELKPEAYRDTPAALGFALSVIAELTGQAKCRGLVLWCLTQATARDLGRPYGPGLASAGLDPSRLLIVEARTEDDAAWALEEGLKSGALLAALAGTRIRTPLAARRLGLAAQASRTPCLLLSGHRGAGLPGTLTHWRIAAAPSAPAPFDRSALGAACWRLTLERCRGAAPGQSFRVEFSEFSHESDRLRVAAASCDRAVEAGKSGAGRRINIG